MTTPTPSPVIRLGQLLKQRLDFIESRLSTLEFASRQQTADSEFSQQFEAIVAEIQALNPTPQPPMP